MFGALKKDDIKARAGKWVTLAYDKARNHALSAYGGNFYLGGDLTLILAGGFGKDFYEVAGGLTFVLTGAMMSDTTKRPWLFAPACFLTIPGWIATNHEGLMAGAATVVASTVLYTASQLFGAFSKPLTRAFKDAKNILARETLGAPRRLMGILSVASKLPLFQHAIHQGDAGFIAVLGLWTIGDALITLSRPDAAAKPPGPRPG